MNRFLLTPEVWREIIEKVGTKYEDGALELTKIDPFQTEDGDPGIEDFFGITLTSFWNASVQSLYEDWKKYFDDEDEGSIYSKVKNFASGDAGYDFNQHYIKPWQGTLADKYTPDYEGAAQDSNSLQFTNEQGEGYFYRLLMPKNTRRVQAEDLTRNFWVISSVLSGMVDFLFSPNSPILVLQKSIIDEIRELWENVLYLWFSFKLLNEPRVSENYHIEFVPIDGNDNEDRRKFDNFSLISDERINNKLSEYFYKYPESNLLLIPYSRSNAFYRNYHESIQIHYLYFYLRKKNPFSQDWNDEDCKIIKRFKEPLIINIQDYLDNIVAIRENGLSLRLGRPLSAIPSFAETEERLYYGQVRIVPIIEYNTNEENKTSFNFTLSVYDVGEYYHLGGDEVSTQDNLIDRITFSYEEEQDGDIEWQRNKIEKNSFTFFNYPRRNLDAYKGENLTTLKQSIKRVTYKAGGTTDIQMKGDLFKIGNFFSSTATQTLKNGYVFKEQVNSSKTHTNYLANLSIGYTEGDGKSPTTSNGVAFGASLGTPWKPSVCSFYTPVARVEPITSDNWTWGNDQTKFYWECKENSEEVDNMDNYWEQILDINAKEKNIYTKDEITKEHLKYIGIITLRRILKNAGYLEYLRQKGEDTLNWTLSDPITFIGAYGVEPWGGNQAKKINGHQVYWESVVLQGLYLYIPKELDNKIDESYKKDYIKAEFNDGNKILGYIYFLREINKSEVNFGGNTYFTLGGDGDHWRLVKNIGEREQGITYLEVYQEDGVTKAGILKLTAGEAELIDEETTTQEERDEFVTTILSNNPERLLSEGDIVQELVKEVFSNCSGIWRVYDGYNTSTAGNKTNYLNYRQVVDSRYNSNDNDFNLKAIVIRSIAMGETWKEVSTKELPDYQNLIWGQRGVLTNDVYNNNSWS